jgi:hypothetical protein
MAPLPEKMRCEKAGGGLRILEVKGYLTKAMTASVRSLDGFGKARAPLTESFHASSWRCRHVLFVCTTAAAASTASSDMDSPALANFEPLTATSPVAWGAWVSWGNGRLNVSGRYQYYVVLVFFFFCKKLKPPLPP